MQVQLHGQPSWQLVSGAPDLKPASHARHPPAARASWPTEQVLILLAWSCSASGDTDQALRVLGALRDMDPQHSVGTTVPALSHHILLQMGRWVLRVGSGVRAQSAGQTGRPVL